MDISACVVRWHAVCRFAGELDLAEIARTIWIITTTWSNTTTITTSVTVASTRARTGTGLRSSLRLLAGRRWQFETSNFSLPEVNSSSHVHIALRAFRLSRLLDNPPISIRAHFDGVTKFADTHATVLDQSRDFASDLVGVLGHELSADVDV
jgi:hypothetical protein